MTRHRLGQRQRRGDPLDQRLRAQEGSRQCAAALGDGVGVDPQQVGNPETRRQHEAAVMEGSQGTRDLTRVGTQPLGVDGGSWHERGDHALGVGVEQLRSDPQARGPLGREPLGDAVDPKQPGVLAGQPQDAVAPAEAQAVVAVGDAAAQRHRWTAGRAHLALEPSDQLAQIGQVVTRVWRLRLGSYTFMGAITQTCGAFVKWKVGLVELETLRAGVDAGEIETVVLALTDMQGRLQGKRLTARYFLDEVLGHGAEGCNYLLAVDVEMNTVDGYAMSSWDKGYGDFVMRPDLATLRMVPWETATAMCLADLAWADGGDVVASPRQILRAQLARLAERGWTANASTELEFLVFRDSYEQAWKQGYRELEPANAYNVDYSLLGTARVEPLIRRIRNSMTAAELVVENSKGECNLGQHEINFGYSDALRCADSHTIYKNGAKEIAAQEGMAISFMAKFNEREGNSCHIHFSLADAEGPLFQRDQGMFDAFLAGQLAYGRELTLLLAPNINSYKRYAVGSFAPTTVAWGHDNRTCALRVVGHGGALRFENRSGGADLNPYLALSALIAAGLEGVERGLELEPAFEGNAYEAADKPRLPSTLHDARDLFAASTLARAAFGEEVVAHYLNAADVELAAFDAAVTDWERVRGFERL